MSFEGNIFKNSWFRISCNLKFNLYPPFIVPRVHKGCKVSGKYFLLESNGNSLPFSFLIFSCDFKWNVKERSFHIQSAGVHLNGLQLVFIFSYLSLAYPLYPPYPHSLHIQLHKKMGLFGNEAIIIKRQKNWKCDPTHVNRISLLNSASHPIHLHILLGFWAIVALKKDSK